MYISKIHIKNYRTYDDLEIKFNDRINIIIGHNNAGKSNLIKAISLFFDSNTKKNLGINDFNKNISLQELKIKPPKIFIELTIKESYKENLMSDDLVTVSNWLIKLEEPYEAKLTYEYFLDPKLESKYVDKVKGLKEKEEVWNIIEEDFIRFYNYKIWGGNIENRIVAESESLQKFDFQFLNAVRDVERDMFNGKNTMLKKVLDFFMDYEIKSNEKLTEEKLPNIFHKMHQALKTNGIIYTSFKYGTFEGERNGRYFTDFTEVMFEKFAKQISGLQIEKMWITGDVREGRGDERWLNILLRKTDVC